MAASQIQSFVWKSQELAHSDITANLNFISCYGNVFATFATELGKANPPTMVNHTHFYEFPKSNKSTQSKKSRSDAETDDKKLHTLLQKLPKVLLITLVLKTLH